ncbi:MAG: hypothetical protein LIP01_02955 [Tannerellaceae bacterium]|nr:hypothetical protein [Tannerellaceae bacterium]
MRDAYDQLHEDRDLEDEFDNEGYEIYTMEQLLRFVYDTEDKVTESLQQQVYYGLRNSAFEAYFDYIPATEIVLKPDTDKPLLPKSSELLYWWLEELISAFEKYGKTDLITVFENYEKEN